MVRAAYCFVNFNKQNAVHIFRANCRHACQQQLAEDSQSRNWDEHAGSISRDGNKVFTCMMFDGTYDYGRERCTSLKSGCDGQCNSYALRSPFPAKSRCPGWDTNVTTMQIIYFSCTFTCSWTSQTKLNTLVEGALASAGLRQNSAIPDAWCTWISPFNSKTNAFEQRAYREVHAQFDAAVPET